MYHNWTAASGQAQQPYYYPDSQHGAEYSGYSYPSTSPPSNDYYGRVPAQPFPTQQQQMPRHQSYTPPDPRLTVHQTNQTLTAIASARRLSQDYIKELPIITSPTRNDHHGQRHRSYYDAQQPQQKPHHFGHGEPSGAFHGCRSAQSPILVASGPSSSGGSHQKSNDGHACSYCGKAFGRPSALKIHLAIHTGERAFICPEAGCHRSFSVRSNMSRHVRNVHQIWPEESEEDILLDGDKDTRGDSYSEPEPDLQSGADHDDQGGPSNRRSSEAIDGLEDMVISFLLQLSSFGRTSRDRGGSDVMDDSGSEDIPTHPKSHRNKSKIELQLVDRGREGPGGSTAFKCVKFPRRCTRGSIRPMAQLLRVLDLTHEALVDDVPATKRDIYYKDVPLFKSQRIVDSLVDDLAATLELERSDLNIRATSKGLICGSGLVIHLYTGDVVQIHDTEGTLIPVGEDIKSFGVDTRVAWVLVLEKEAVFQTLCRLKFACHASLPGCGLIITGKGYPDIATRHLVKTLADGLPSSIPILCMVDADPYGIDILSVYKYGSRALHHEHAKLAAERIQWLGLRSSELETFGVDRDRLLQITKHDETKALAMLRRPAVTMPRNWRKELMHMLHGRRKAEIEVLSTTRLELQVYALNRQSSNTQNEALSPDAKTKPEACHNDQTPCSPLSDTGSSATSFFSPTGTEASHSYSSPLASPPSSPPTPASSKSLTPSHTPLMRYLVYKITESVTSARARARSVESLA
ncbi:putative DNA topoisomerase IV alpha subunit [Lyophyllum shimeji]|uniref:pH-response transcription factor pacC/RIM101 n=1 Tax=Lyophyllum shimeji TaxID=47721 RepID=A0A9P3PXY3_LYOSH|nr:putative DNA topoisomerase IV alpha subunit [Lyophyllum shimeji]